MTEHELTILLNQAAREIVGGIIRRAPFPLNVNALTITELHDTISRHVKYLSTELDKAKTTKQTINELNRVEASLLNDLRKIESLEALFQKFWEEQIAQGLRREYEYIISEYNRVVQELKEKMGYLRDLTEIQKTSERTSIEIRSLVKRAEPLVERYSDLFSDARLYLKMGLTLVAGLQENVITKLTMSDKSKIEQLLNELRMLYDDTLTQLEKIISEIREKNLSVSELPITRTILLEKEQIIKENIIREIKDLDQLETLIIMEVIKASASRRSRWLPLSEACQIVTQTTHQDVETIKKILWNMAEKGFLTFAIGF
ncbi:MAG: hypothetical protein QXJ55_06205 [Candidatus Caldarchaeum sp.]